jgi:hypothetical protein
MPPLFVPGLKESVENWRVAGNTPRKASPGQLKKQKDVKVIVQGGFAKTYLAEVK